MPGHAVIGRVVGLVVSGAGGADRIREDFVEPAVQRGWRVAVTATPTAATWLEQRGEVTRLESLTGLPLRSAPRLPGEARPHPPAECVLVAPASANTVAKLAVGIADNQALTVAVEAVGDLRVPVVVFPRINAAHARHPAWTSHMAALMSAGVHVVQGEELWPLYEPHMASPGRPIPWSHIIGVVDDRLKAGGDPDTLYG